VNARALVSHELGIREVIVEPREIHRLEWAVGDARTLVDETRKRGLPDTALAEEYEMAREGSVAQKGVDRSRERPLAWQ
jgi:hypothetical protein